MTPASLSSMDQSEIVFAGACPVRPLVRDVLLLALAFSLLVATPLVAPEIGRHGEAREGLVVQDMVQHGHWILPMRNGELPSKPPLFHWIGALAGEAFGVSDPIVRLPSALAALVMLLATFLIGVEIGGRRTGWLAVGALAGTVPFWTSATEARVDMVFAACVTLSITGFFFWQRRSGQTVRALFWVGAAAAVLAKGPAGALLAGAIALLASTWARRPASVAPALVAALGGGRSRGRRWLVRSRRSCWRNALRAQAVALREPGPSGRPERFRGQRCATPFRIGAGFRNEHAPVEPGRRRSSASSLPWGLDRRCRPTAPQLVDRRARDVLGRSWATRCVSPTAVPRRGVDRRTGSRPQRFRRNLRIYASGAGPSQPIVGRGGGVRRP